MQDTQYEPGLREFRHFTEVVTAVVTLLRQDPEFSLRPGGVWTGGRGSFLHGPALLSAVLVRPGAAWPPSAGRQSAGGLTTARLFMRRISGVFLRGHYSMAGITCILAICGTLSKSSLVQLLN